MDRQASRAGTRVHEAGGGIVMPAGQRMRMSTLGNRMRVAATLVVISMCAGLDCLNVAPPIPGADFIPPDARVLVTLRIVNNSGVEVIVDSTFYGGAEEVRRTTRVLASGGTESSETVLATFAVRIVITARDMTTREILAEAELLAHREYEPGDTVIFRIPPKDLPPGENPPPIADAGPDQVVAAGSQVTLDGSGSRDPLAEPISYQWRQASGPTPLSIDDPNAAQASFVAPAVSTPTRFDLDLDVSDGSQTATDRVTIDVLPDCDGNGITDVEDILNGAPDCQGDGIPDVCQLSADCDGNGVPDECDPDCDGNGTPDACDILTNPMLDCDGNGAIDACEIAAGTAADCNANGTPDVCDIAACTNDPACADCNQNLVPDGCELTGNDCDGNLVPDECDPDAHDVDGFVFSLLYGYYGRAVGKGELPCQFDANGDGRLDGADIGPFVERLLGNPAAP